MDVTVAQRVVDKTVTINLHGEEAQLATNPTTNPQVLHELANSKNWELRRLVASNPNTPTESLWQLGIDFPEAILANPIFELLQLEHLHLAAQIPHCTLTSLLQCDRVPMSFMEYAIRQQDYSLWLAVAYNSQTPSSLLQNLAQKSRRQDRELIRAVAAHPNTPSELFAEIIDIGCGVAQIVAENPHTPVAILKQLLQIYGQIGDLKSVFTTLVALHPHFTPQLLLDTGIAPTPASAQALWLAKQPPTTSVQLTELSQTGWNVLLLAIVRHPNSPAAIVEQIWHRMRLDRLAPSHNFGEINWKEHRLIYDSFVCNPHISLQLRGELRKLLQ
jgi:hypothetical protein